MDAKKKVGFAVSLVLLWAGLAVSQWRLLEEPAHVPLTNVTGPAVAGRQTDGSGGGLYVNRELLAAAGIRREATFMTPRNVFAEPRPEEALPLTTAPALANQEGAASAEAVPEQVGAMESSQFQYLGFLRMGEGKRKNKEMAVLSKDDEVLVLKVGDRVDDHLVLKAINSENVVLRDSGTRVDQTVSLSEEPPAQE